MSAAERKKKQRQRDKLLGWQEVTVRVAADQADVVRDFAAKLPAPSTPRMARVVMAAIELAEVVGEFNEGGFSSSTHAEIDQALTEFKEAVNDE